MGIATLSSKGQLTIPSDIRQRLDLKSGDKVEFRLNANGTVTLAAVNEPLDALFGCINYRGPALGVDDIANGIKVGATEGETPRQRATRPGKPDIAA
jgi:antitoxin PrlF